MKKLLLVILGLVTLFSVTSCQNDAKNTKTTVSTSVEEKEEVKQEEPQAEKVSMGDVITTEFVEMSIDEGGIKNDLKTSIKTGSITYTSGPEESDSSEFIYIRGKIKNNSKSKIDNAYIGGKIDIDGYEYELKSASFIESDGRTAYSLEPLVEYTYTVYAEVPNELVQSGKEYTIQFGFNDLLEQDYNSEVFEYNYQFKGV